MDNPAVAAALNELLAAEQQSLVRRLCESTLFVSRLDVAAGNLVQAMAKANREHCAALTDLILDLGGYPAPRRVDPLTADLHYLELHHVLPRLVSDQEGLVDKYSLAGPNVAADARAAALVAKALDRRRRDLEKLKTITLALPSKSA